MLVELFLYGLLCSGFGLLLFNTEWFSIEVSSRMFMIDQPASPLTVFGLAVMTLAFGVLFLKYKMLKS